MSSSPDFVGIDTVAVKEATRNNYANQTSTSFSDKLYSATAYMSSAFGPALASSVEQANGSGSQSAMIVDAAVNAAASNATGLSSLDSSLAGYSTGGAYSGMQTSGTGLSGFSAVDSISMSSDGSTDMVSQMTATNAEMIALQATIQQESLMTQIQTSIQKAGHEASMAVARNVA